MSTLTFFRPELQAQNPDYLTMVQYATKAPSGHNSQPWVFEIGASHIEIHPDFTRALPVVDSNHRELYISLGCAAENLSIAALELGYEPDLKVVSEPGSQPYIYIELITAEKQKSQLFEMIEKRQTNRSIYQNRLIHPDTLKILGRIKTYPGTNIHFFEKGSHEFNILKNHVAMGNTIQMMDKEFKQELLQWMRFNGIQKKKNPDGLTYNVMKMPPVPGFLGKTIVGSFLKPEAQNKGDMEKIDSSSHFVLFTLSEDNIENWILLGRTLQQYLLESTRLGIAIAYLNQPCEVSKLANQLSIDLDLDNQVPVLLLRTGYAEPLPYSPRRELNQVVQIKN